MHFEQVEKGIPARDNTLLVILLSIYLALAALSPSIFSLGDSLPFRIDDIFLLLIFYYVLLIALRNKSFTLPKPLLGFYFLLLSMLVSLAYAMLAQWVAGLTGLYHEVFRLIKYLIVLFVFWRAGQSARDNELLVRVFIGVSVATALVAVAQVFDPLGLNEFIATHYRPGSMQASLTNVWHRSTGQLRSYSTFYDPNIYGLFTLVPFSLSLALLLRNKSVRVFAPLASLFFLAILLSQSRAALACSLLAFALTIAIVSKRSGRLRFRRAQLVMVALVVIILCITVMLAFGGLRRITSIASAAFSLGGRFGVWRATVAMIFTKSPLVGLSTATETWNALDNEYIYILYWGGIIGLIAYGFYITILYRSIPKTADPLHIVVSVMILTFLVANFSLGTLLCDKLYTLFIALYGLALARPPGDGRQIPA